MKQQFNRSLYNNIFQSIKLENTRSSLVLPSVKVGDRHTITFTRSVTPVTPVTPVIYGSLTSIRGYPAPPTSASGHTDPNVMFPQLQIVHIRPGIKSGKVATLAFFWEGKKDKREEKLDNAA